MTCIIENKGQVIISPASLKSFLQLDDIFRTGTDLQTKNSIVQGTFTIGDLDLNITIVEDRIRIASK